MYIILWYFLQNELCEIATDILNNEANTNLKNNKIEWGLYLRLINDEKAKLDYETIIPFEDILVLDDLIIDKRLVWSDDRLFKFITKNADANQVSAISFHCPVETIKKHIDEDDVQWDWIILSQFHSTFCSCWFTKSDFITLMLISSLDEMIPKSQFN